MSLHIKTASFRIDSQFVQGSKDQFSARVVGNNIIVRVDVEKGVHPRYSDSKARIRIPKIDGTVHVRYFVEYPSDDEYGPYYEFDAFIRPQHEEDFMAKRELDYVEVVKDLSSKDDGERKWRADGDVRANTWDYVFSDGKRVEVETETLGGSRRYLYFYLKDATWVICENKGFNQICRTMYTTRQDWWNLT